MNPQLAAADKSDPNDPMAQAQPDADADDMNTGKVSADDSGYQDQADTCSTCSHFQGDGQPCQVVSDPVSSGGWCKLHEGSEATGQTQPTTESDATGAAGSSPAGGSGIGGF